MNGCIRTFVLGAIFALVAACGGGDSNVVSSQNGGTVTSPDGLVTLVFPPGAVDEDTKITIDRTDASALPPEVQALDLLDQIYRLEPDGIVFNVPVEATITLEGVVPPTDEASASDSVEYFSWDETNGLEPLGDEAITGEVTQAMVIDVDAGTVGVRGTLRHFSLLTGTRNGIRYSFFPPPPSPQPTGATFQGTLVLTNTHAANSGISYVVTRVAPRGHEPVTALTEAQQPMAALPAGGLRGYVSPAIRFRCGPPSGKGRYAVRWFTTVTLPPGAQPKVTATWKSGTQFLSFAGISMRKPKGSDTLLSSGAAFSAMTCGTVDDGDSGSSSGSDTDTDSSGDTDGDGCTTEEVGAVLDQFTGPEFAGSVLGELQSSIGSVDSSATSKMCENCGTFPHKDDHTHGCKVTGVETPTNQEVRVVRPTAGHLTAQRSPSRALPCGTDGETTTLCPAGAQPMPPGDYVVVAHVLYDVLPQMSADKYYQYGFVFDADGDPTNNYVPPQQFVNDFFRDTDLWFVASHDPATGWELQITDATNNNPTSVSINARIVIRGNALVLIAPPDAFGVPDPAYRVTAFEHNGMWADDPAASGDTEPPVEIGLRPFDGGL